MIAVSIYCCLIKYRVKQKTFITISGHKWQINECIINDSNDELNEVNIKNRTCYCFDDIIKIEDFNLDNILIDGKSFENNLVYSISYKTLIDAKPLRVRFDKVDGFIRVYDGTRYFVLFGSEKYDFIYNRTRYVIGVKSGIIYVISRNYAKIKVDSCDSLPLEKTMTFHNVIILKSVFNKYTNNYYYNRFLEKIHMNYL